MIDAEVPTGLAVHVILDNYSTHKHADVQRWLGRNKRFHLHFIPTSSSWLNQVERWFRDLDGKALRRGSFNSVPGLIAAIEDYLQANNEDPTRSCGRHRRVHPGPRSHEPATNCRRLNIHAPPPSPD